MAIRQVKSGKAAGPDNIPAEALKADVAATARILHILFNKIWDDEQVPKYWKEGIVVKIPKKGDLSKCDNYRGITLLSIPGNVFNRILLTRMKDSVDTRLRGQQYSDIRTKNANLPVMSVVTFDSQCTTNDVTNSILPSLPLEAHKQVLSSNATTLKKAFEIEIPLPRKNNVSTEPSGSRPNIKSTTMTLPNKNKTILPDTMFYLTHRRGGYKGRLGSNVSQDGHCNHYVSRPNIGQTTMNQHTLRLSSDVLNNIPVRPNYSHHFPIGQDGLLGYSTSNVLNNKPVRRNFPQHFPIGQDGLLGYAPSTQPQLTGACLTCPPNEVQQINPLYQNDDFFGLQKFLVPLAIQEALGFFTLHSPFLNLLLINARSLLNKISALRTSAFLAKPSFILITETWFSQAVSNSELNIQNHRLYRCDRETKRGGGCIIYALDTLTTNKVEDSVLNSLPESVWISVNTLNHSLLLGCIYRAPDSPNSGNDLIINASIHASFLNFNAKVITGDFNYPGIN
ncbi:unnamed protein product [Schistosoma mattheei]|uniref:Uncharacterized protein n=1 Tax=Schistosoma mattheei TaxID=31246 RepID=A0A183PJH5_9TREM|nr:unnamed protein product [Schistosoma mattheei]